MPGAKAGPYFPVRGDHRWIKREFCRLDFHPGFASDWLKTLDMSLLWHGKVHMPG